ncbi:hypothetical protein D3C77_302690 [compost metagenome]
MRCTAIVLADMLPAPIAPPGVSVNEHSFVAECRRAAWVASMHGRSSLKGICSACNPLGVATFTLKVY